MIRQRLTRIGLLKCQLAQFAELVEHYNAVGMARRAEELVLLAAMMREMLAHELAKRS